MMEAPKDLQKTSMPQLTVRKFTISKFEIFIEKFKSDVSRMGVFHGFAIYYLLREVDGNYNYNCTSRREKLRNCLCLAVNQFKHNPALLYQLYIQYIGTAGHGFNIFKKYSRTKNGYKLHSDL